MFASRAKDSHSSTGILASLFSSILSSFYNIIPYIAEINTIFRITDIINSLYPVGSVYIGTQSTCPLTTLIPNSTWELIAADRVLQGASGSHDAGSTVEAGVPEIYGTARDVTSKSDTSQIATGAFYPVQNSAGGRGGTYNGTNSSTGYWRTGFAASRYSSVYGKSSTVQPPAYVVNIWRRST